jgi:glycerol-3-phosphate O-acyltransferase/dihydroxyacetone phosphate acyltransferase
MVWALLALPGTILNGPMFILATIISRKKAKEALAGSVVKVAGRDVLATWKVLISLGVAPVLYSFYAFLATLVAIKAQAPLKWRIWTPFLVAMVLPFMNYASLKFGEAGMDVLKSLRPLVVALVPGQQRSLDRLKAMRVQLSNEVAELINEFGPKLYEDFDEWRILVPSASVPPSTGKPGVWRRKSSTGAVDAQGNLLIHPMTWLDERLFGWSRSAKRGTSAWGGIAPSTEISRNGTPDASDDEDGGDYDNVIGYLPPEDQVGSPRTPRSRQNSYADLQRLRMTSTGTQANKPVSLVVPGTGSSSSTSSPSTPADSDGLHYRQGPRARKQSLTDQVPVGRIAALDRRESFGEATQDLNEEIRRVKGERT